MHVLVVFGKAPQHFLCRRGLQVKQRVQRLQLWELIVCTKTRQHIPRVKPGSASESPWELGGAPLEIALVAFHDILTMRMQGLRCTGWVP